MSAVNNINPGAPLYTAAAQPTANNTGIPEESTPAVTPRQDIYTKSGEIDTEKVSSMKAELRNNMAAFKMMVQSLMKNQGKQASTALGDIFKDITVDEETRLAAQAAIAEDGYWGVEQTAGRILDFAKALSGGDESKIDLLQDAVLAGFEAAEKAWGGKLADICYQTKERILEGFDEWRASFKAEEE